MTEFTVLFIISGEDEKYLEQAASLRNITKTQIVRRAVEFVLQDKLFLSVFDDDDKPSPKTESKRKQRKYLAKQQRQQQREMFDTTKSYSVPTRTHTRVMGHPAKPKTRAECEHELQQAVLNTGGELK